MRASIITKPSLGRLTVVEHILVGQAPSGDANEYSVQFDVALHINLAETPGHQWTVEVWHNHLSRSQQDEWTALPLQQDTTPKAQTACSLESDYNTNCLWFRGTLVGYPCSGTRTDFTVRFRRDDDTLEDHWRWATSYGGAENGVLLYQPALVSILARDLIDYLPLPQDTRLSVLRRRSETPHTLLWLITASDAVPATGERSGWTTWSLGRPNRVERWFALTRISPPWLGPFQGCEELADGEAIVYSFLRSDGLHVVVLAVSGVQADGDIQTVLCRGSDLRHLTAVSRNDDTASRQARIVVSVGRSFDLALAAAIYEARKLVMSYSLSHSFDGVGRNVDSANLQTPNRHSSNLQQEPNEVQQAALGGRPVASWFQEWVDGLAYCTWNGIGLDLSEEKVLLALSSLEDSGIHISNLIIDDGWQSVDNPGKSNMLQGWKSFEADNGKFPSGLRGFVDKLKTQSSSLRHVAVWHALLGYWAGLARSERIATSYRTRNVSIRSDAMFSNGRMLVTDVDDELKLYEDFYGFLEEAGISAVKTDVQFALDELDCSTDRRDLSTPCAHAWQNTYLRYFAGRAIACMAQTPSLIFGTYLRNDIGPAIPMRNSDDFIPDNESSHLWHVWCNAHNAVFSSFLNVIPDWDMFQTNHAWAEWHAAARCLSGGPICITDEPGKSNVQLIQRISAETPRGDTIILRPSVFGRTADVYSGFKEEHLCRISCYNGDADTGTGMMGLFNMGYRSLKEVVRINEFMGVTTHRKYVVRSFRSKRVCGLFDTQDVLSPQIDSHAWDILTAYRVWSVSVYSAAKEEPSTIRVASLGLLDHLVGSVALMQSDIDVRPPLPDDRGKP